MSALITNGAACRRMTEEDLDRVSAIEEAVHAHPWTRGNFADSLLAGHHCYVAEQDGEIVGYAVVMTGAAEAHLLNVSVAAGWQRRGIGFSLTQLCLALAREAGAQAIFLEVRPSNTAARALYARMGFAEVGARRGYYPARVGREDALVMERTLA